ncbi:hydroxymethylglutaryl-CoA lyase [Xenophilus arseniciresistens]|uniref:Hydroxymethylglutaryl-CoA lyase n=1 Tax=Xenophilus arseniciresistens TaxID=1283306 RepID=A0AAE3T116_9BURK|nr:hydroxymethylglutaryl-CoA lyase [Xenophilus arseniciresistens]MDA7417531.1 hydroxymethylglutaryl-CoA lyase [Xenophilus arseniciresistens]
MTQGQGVLQATDERIVVTDVSPRDGLQSQPVPVSTPAKLELIRLLAAAGVPSIEATSFVSPKAVPQMADAAAVLAGLAQAAPGLRASVLAPNLKGLDRALAAGAREVAVVLSATETMNRRNINMGLADATAVSEETLRAARGHGLATRAYVAVAVECPFEGAVAPGVVVELAERMLAAGADEIVLADTIGAASPGQVRALLRAAAPSIPVAQTGVHLHDTRGFGVANAWVALEAGIRRFDASAGGIGGCPFAPGAAGNLATEDLVLLAQQSGLATGISLDGLAAAVAFAEQQLDRPLGGRSLGWWRRRARPAPG